jgi:hypothetical protein
VLDTQPGRLWLRLHALPGSNYAENGAPLAPSELPIFVTVLHARRPEDDALRVQALALTQAVAAAVARAQTQVHVTYAASGAGRMAFGGNLVE